MAGPFVVFHEYLERLLGGNVFIWFERGGELLECQRRRTQHHFVVHCSVGIPSRFPPAKDVSTLG